MNSARVNKARKEEEVEKERTKRKEKKIQKNQRDINGRNIGMHQWTFFFLSLLTDPLSERLRTEA